MTRHANGCERRSEHFKKETNGERCLYKDDRSFAQQRTPANRKRTETMSRTGEETQANAANATNRGGGAALASERLKRGRS